VVERDDLPNRTQESIIGSRASGIGVGFTQPEQRDLLVPFVERYFAVLPQVWRTRTLEIARNIVSGLYPKLFVAPDTVAATDAFLAAPDVPPALRRLLIEARDDVVRALAAQARDRAATPIE
jgi:aminopeptidase N